MYPPMCHMTKKKGFKKLNEHKKVYKKEKSSTQSKYAFQQIQPTLILQHLTKLSY